MVVLAVSSFQDYLRDGVAALPPAERALLFLQGVGGDEEPDLDVLREALALGTEEDE